MKDLLPSICCNVKACWTFESFEMMTAFDLHIYIYIISIVLLLLSMELFDTALIMTNTLIFVDRREGQNN